MKTGGHYATSSATWDNQLHRGIVNAVLIEVGIIIVIKLIYEFIKKVIQE